MKSPKLSKRIKKITSVVMCVLIAVSCCSISASAATKSKSKTLTYNYYDSIITSWKVVSIKGNFKWAYNNRNNKLVNQTDVSYSTPTMVLGCFAKNFKTSKPYYSTSTKNGNGRLKLSWTAGCGLSTTWITIGQSLNDYMGVNVKGNGKYSTFFS